MLAHCDPISLPATKPYHRFSSPEEVYLRSWQPLVPLEPLCLKHVLVSVFSVVPYLLVFVSELPGEPNGKIFVKKHTIPEESILLHTNVIHRRSKHSNVLITRTGFQT